MELWLFNVGRGLCVAVRADIENVTDLLPPSILLRRTDLTWRKVTSDGNDRTAAMQHYDENYMPPQYNEPVAASDIPDWGLVSR